jgi:hypothetical protein
MRRSLATLAIAAAVSAVVLPTTQANAIYCGPVVHTACQTVCRVTAELDIYCVA